MQGAKWSSLDGDELREKIREERLLTPAQIDALFEEWRYAERPAIRLALFLQPVSVPAAPELLAAVDEALATLQPDSGASAVQLRDIDDSFDAEMVEIAVRFAREREYIDPAERMATFVEAGFGFAWIGAPGRFLAVAAPDDVAELMRRVAGIVVGHEPVWISISKEAMDAEFPFSDVASVTHFDQLEHVRERSSRDRLSETKVFPLIVARDHQQQRTGITYTQHLSSGRRVNINVNADRGRLNFIGRLSASDLRKWGMTRVKAVARRLQGLRERQPGEFMQHVRASLRLVGIARAHAPAAQAVALAVLEARAKNTSEFPIAGYDAGRIGTELPEKYGQLAAFPFCDGCGDVQSVTCEVCGGSSVNVADAGVECAMCGPRGDLACAQGHHPRGSALRDGLQFNPSLELIDVISDGLVRVGGDAVNATAETITIRGGRVQRAMKPGLDPGTYTCLYVDIEKSTPLLQLDPERHAKVLRLTRRGLVSTALERDGRYIKSTGDGGFSLYRQPIEALRAALDMREMVRTHSTLFEGHPIRIAVATGTIERTLDDYSGPAINLASRLQEKARTPHHVVVDQVTRDALQGIGLNRAGLLSSLKGIDLDGGYYFLPDRLSEKFRESLSAA